MHPQDVKDFTSFDADTLKTPALDKPVLSVKGDTSVVEYEMQAKSEVNFLVFASSMSFSRRALPIPFRVYSGTMK